MGLFTGLKIIDLTRVFSGPFATRLFADYGATVIKIESPDRPDDSRSFGPIKNSASGYYETLNRRKQGVKIDLRTEKGKKEFFRLVSDADVVVENYRPGTKQRLGISYEDIIAHNPHIILASIAGISQDCDEGYYDVIGQAESGLMSLSGMPGNPTKIGTAVVDAFSGALLAHAISSALWYREKTGIGQWVDVSMLASALNLLENGLADYSVTGKNPEPFGNHDTAIAPFGVYRCADGAIVIAAGNDRLWKRLLSFLSSHVPVPNVCFDTNNDRLKNQRELTDYVERVVSKMYRSEVIAVLKKDRIPVAPVQLMSDVVNDPKLYDMHMLERVSHPKLGDFVTPGRSITYRAKPESEPYCFAPDNH